MSDWDDFEVPGLNPMAQEFVPMNTSNKFVPKESSHTKLKLDTFEHAQDISIPKPKKIPELTYDILKYFPEKMTLPPPGVTINEHLREMIMKKYDCGQSIIPPELYNYMINSGMIVLKK